MKTYMNHGRWVVECGTPNCAEAALADSATVCLNCGRPYAVAFPNDRALIDAALSRRIVPETRNWVQGETVQDLVAENAAHEHEGTVV